MQTFDKLKIFPLFAGLNDREFEILAANVVRRSFAKGVYIYRPGTSGSTLYLIESGLVRMFFENDRQEEFMMNLVAPPGCFGLPLLPDNQLRIAGAAAVRDTAALLFSRETVFDLMRRFPQFALNVYTEMSNNLRLLGEYAHDVITLSVPGRLARLILHFSTKYTGDANEIDLLITQSDLATIIGSSRGRTNRALAKLQAHGVIRVERQKIYILNREKLDKISKM